MADLTNFIPLRVETLDTIIARMDADVNAGIDPTDDDFIDTTPGTFYADIRTAIALELERLWDVATTDTVAASLVEYAWGDYLDAHGETLGLTRNDATAASGKLTFTGTNGSLIAEGTEVSTVQTQPDEDAISFVTTEGGTIADGEVTLSAEAAEPGAAGNVAAGAVTLLLSAVAGVETVTNDDAFTGGADIESDEAYRGRIKLGWSAARGAGSVADYQRWALGYPGIGFVSVFPLWNGAGTVRVVITDVDNNPVQTTVIDEVQELLDPIDALTNTIGSAQAPASGSALTFLKVLTAADFDSTGQIYVGTGVTNRTLVVYTGKAAARTISFTATGGTFTLTYDGQTTSALAYDASAATVQTALEALSNIGVGEALVTKHATGSYTIIFAGTLINTTATTTGNGSSLTGGSTTVTVESSDAFTGCTGFAVDQAISSNAEVRQQGSGRGLAPVGAVVTVGTADLLEVAVAATITLEEGYSLNGAGGTIAVDKPIEDVVTNYINNLPPGGDIGPAGTGKILRNRIASLILSVPGVYNVDVSTVTPNDLSVDPDQVPVVDTITITEA